MNVHVRERVCVCLCECVREKVRPAGRLAGRWCNMWGDLAAAGLNWAKPRAVLRARGQAGSVIHY